MLAHFGQRIGVKKLLGPLHLLHALLFLPGIVMGKCLGVVHQAPDTVEGGVARLLKLFEDFLGFVEIFHPVFVILLEDVQAALQEDGLCLDDGIWYLQAGGHLLFVIQRLLVAGEGFRQLLHLQVGASLLQQGVQHIYAGRIVREEVPLVVADGFVVGGEGRGVQFVSAQSFGFHYEVVAFC